MKTLIAALVVAVAAAGTSAVAEKSKDLEKRVSVSDRQTVEIRGLRGSDVEFRTWDKPEVYVKLRVEVSSSDDTWETKYIESVDLKEDVTTDRAVITFEEPRDQGRSGFSFRRLFSFRWYVSKEIRGEVYIPRKNAFFTDVRYGKISLESMEGEVRLDGQSNTISIKDCRNLAEIRNDYGTVVIERSAGNLKLGAKSGRVTVEEFAGDLDLDADYSTISLSKLSKSLDLRTKSATVTIADVSGDAAIVADYSRVTVDRVKGFVSITDKSGTVRVRTVDGVSVDAPYSTVEISDVAGTGGKQITVRGQSGRLDISDANGNVKVDNPYSVMGLRNIKGDVEVRTQSGTIRAENITGNWRSSSSYSGVTLRDLRAKSVMVETSSSGVDIECASKPDQVEIRNTYGGASLRIPRGVQGRVRLKAEYGTVRTNLPVEKETFGNGALASGTIGTGTGSLIVEVRSGDINVDEQ